MLIALAPGVLLACVAGFWAYMVGTARPLHSSAKDVPSVTRSQPAPQWADAVAKARELVRTDLVEQNLPGVSVAIGVGGEVVWAEGFGLADLETREPVEPEMRFRIGAVSMPLTATAVGLLLEQGRLRLDDEIQTYVPGFPRKQWPITLHELMEQTSGIRQDGGDEEPLRPRCERAVDALNRFQNDALLFQPGTQFRYSAYGWVLVSAAVEAVAGQRFFRFMREQVLDPLGMSDTTEDLSVEPLPKLATFYYPRFAGETRYGPEPARSGDYSCLTGALGFLSTPSDLVRFGLAMNAGKLLRPDTLKMLQAEQRLASGKATGYGLGWDLESASIAGATVRQLGHDGEYLIGGSTSFITFPERGIVVAVTTNISFAKMEPIARRIADAFAKRR
jgi:CubicO group peptidase (beta-lactamase class C family)